MIVNGVLKSMKTSNGIDWEWVECEHCGREVDFQECYDCEYGASHHDCGEDTCCCLDPEPNVTCDTCNGGGGWYVCSTCKAPKGRQS